MLFADLELSRRLERAEGDACVQFARARQQLMPDSHAEWIEHAGAYAAFDGPASPVTQSFGLGLSAPLSTEILDVFERFFLDRGAPVQHEISPLAGVDAIDLLCSRHYRPLEISNVLYQQVEEPAARAQDAIRVRVIEPDEADIWAKTHAQGWVHEHPELRDFVLQSGKLSAAREGGVCFLAELEGRPGAAGALSIHQGVALFAGAATIPALRRHGLHAALFEERMRYAFCQGCDLAMVVAEAGSNSQRNAERQGFRVAYTRTKWRLESRA